MLAPLYLTTDDPPRLLDDGTARSLNHSRCEAHPTIEWARLGRPGLFLKEVRVVFVRADRNAMSASSLSFHEATRFR